MGLKLGYRLRVLFVVSASKCLSTFSTITV
jgi:hypothetical protein